MAFDASTARPADSGGGFDPSTARPDMGPGSIYERTAKKDSALDNLVASFGGIAKGGELGLQKLGSMVGVTSAPSDADVQELRDAMSGLWSTKMGKVGTVGGGLAMALPAAMVAGSSIPGAAAVGGLMGALQPTKADESVALNTGLGALTGGVTQKAANTILPPVANYLQNRITQIASSLDQKAANNTARDAVLQAGQTAGFKVPGTMANPDAPGIINRILESVSGKAATQQQASIDNQAMAKALVRQDLGLVPNAPLTDQTFETVRAVAGRPYQAVASSGVPMAPDTQYVNQIAGIFKPYNDSVAQAPSLKIPTVEGLQNDLLAGKTFAPDTLVEMVKRLRKDGQANLNNADPERRTLGSIQMDAQGALEGLMDRNLGKAGMKGLIPALQNARQIIAKTYTAQNALEGGNVVGSRISDKATGPMATVRDMAEYFPKAMQNPATIGSNVGLSPLDHYVSLLTGGAGMAAMGPHGLAGALAWPMARLGARSLGLSGPYQRAMAGPQSYNIGLLNQLAPALLTSDTAGLLGRASVPALSERYIGQ